MAGVAKQGVTALRVGVPLIAVSLHSLARTTSLVLMETVHLVHVSVSVDGVTLTAVWKLYVCVTQVPSAFMATVMTLVNASVSGPGQVTFVKSTWPIPFPSQWMEYTISQIHSPLTLPTSLMKSSKDTRPRWFQGDAESLVVRVAQPQCIVDRIL